MDKFKIGDLVIRTGGSNTGKKAIVKRIDQRENLIGIEFFEPIGLHDFHSEPRGKPKYCFWSDPNNIEKVFCDNADYETIE